MIEDRWPNGTPKMPECYCPVCTNFLDAATPCNNKDDFPKEGDITICAYCAAILEFDVNIKPMLLTKQTMSKMSQQELRNILGIAKYVKAHQKEES